MYGEQGYRLYVYAIGLIESGEVALCRVKDHDGGRSEKLSRATPTPHFKLTKTESVSKRKVYSLACESFQGKPGQPDVSEVNYLESTSQSRLPKPFLLNHRDIDEAIFPFIISSSLETVVRP